MNRWLSYFLKQKQKEEKYLEVRRDAIEWWLEWVIANRNKIDY